MKTNTGEDHVRYLLGVTPKQYEMFVQLNDMDKNDMSSREIQSLTGLDASVITRTLSVLLKQGLVHREYALRGDAPPHYRYKTVTKDEFDTKITLAVEDFTSKVQNIVSGD